MAVITATCLLLLAGGGAVGLLWYQARLDAQIERIPDPFASLSSRPTVPATPSVVPTEPEESASADQAPVTVSDPLNILVLGSDSRISAGDPSQWAYGAQRTDTIMLVHVPADRSAVFTISFQRDTWVDIPGYGMDKINAAYSYGGPPLLIATVEQLLGVYIDHFAVADFESFSHLTDALGGVDITVPEDTYAGQGTVFLEAGTHHMDGQLALDYARERYNLPDGDFGRMQRQQNWMRAIAKQAMSRGTLTNPARLTEFLDVAASAVAVDEGFSISAMRDLALGLRDVRSDDLVFLLAPTGGTGRERNGTAWVSYLDGPLLQELSTAIVEDRVGGFVTDNADRLRILGDSVR